MSVIVRAGSYRKLLLLRILLPERTQGIVATSPPPSGRKNEKNWREKDAAQLFACVLVSNL